MDRRWTVHKCNSRTGETHLYRAMRKYGVENFVIEELCEGGPEVEIELIEKLKPKYNMTAGGEGGDTSKSLRYIKGMKNRVHPHKPTYGMLGKQQSDLWRQAIKKANNCPIKIDGITYNSIKEAIEKTKLTDRQIRSRLDSEKHPNFERLRPRTKRK